MVYFDSSSIYITSATDLQTKIARCEAVIEALFTAAEKAAANEDISEYSLDDGQTKIKTVYKSTASVMAAIEVFQTQQQRYINQLNGRAVRMVDSKNFPSNRRRNGRG